LKDKEQQDEIHEIANLIKKGRLMEIFETLIKNISYELSVLVDADFNIRSTEIKEKLQSIDKRNEMYSQTIYNQLLNDIFLPVKKLDFLRVYESFESIMDKIQRIGHRMGLIIVRDWIKVNHRKMVSILVKLFGSLDDWFVSTENVQYSIDLQKISNLEKEADQLHSMFLERLYSTEDIDFKEFSQAEFIDLTLEDTIDEVERLAEKLYTVILEYRESNKDLPVYLS